MTAINLDSLSRTSRGGLTPYDGNNSLVFTDTYYLPKTASVADAVTVFAQAYQEKNGEAPSSAAVKRNRDKAERAATAGRPFNITVRPA